jgi:hypothetical protein
MFLCLGSDPNARGLIYTSLSPRMIQTLYCSHYLYLGTKSRSQTMKTSEVETGPIKYRASSGLLGKMDNDKRLEISSNGITKDGGR